MFGIFLLLLTAIVSPLYSQGERSGTLAIVAGTVHDAKDQAIANVAVSLDSADPSQTLNKTTDSLGHFRFEAVPAGTYTLRAKSSGFEEAKEGPFVLSAGDTKSITLRLTKARSLAREKEWVRLF